MGGDGKITSGGWGILFYLSVTLLVRRLLSNYRRIDVQHRWAPELTFDFCLSLFRGRSEPVQDRVFFVPFDPQKRSAPASFGNQGQSLDDIGFGGGAATIDYRPHRSRKDLVARFTLIPLLPRFRFS